MMGFIINDDYVPRRSHLAQNIANVSFVALRTSLVNASLFPDLLLSLPIELVPVVNQYTRVPCRSLSSSPGGIMLNSV